MPDFSPIFAHLSGAATGTLGLFYVDGSEAPCALASDRARRIDALSWPQPAAVVAG